MDTKPYTREDAERFFQETYVIGQQHAAQKLVPAINKAIEDAFKAGRHRAQCKLSSCPTRPMMDQLAYLYSDWHLEYNTDEVSGDTYLELILKKPLP